MVGKRSRKGDEIRILNRDCLKKAIEMVKDPTGRHDDCYLHLREKCTRVRRLKMRHFCQHDILRTNEVGPTSVQSLLSQLRRSASEHDWPAVARTIDFMLNLNGKLMPLVWKACFLVLFNHPDSNAQTINDFLLVCIGLKTEEERSLFLTRLLTLPENLDNTKPWAQDTSYMDSDVICLL